LVRAAIYAVVIAATILTVLWEYEPLELHQIRQHLEEVEQLHRINRFYYGEQAARQMEIQQTLHELFPEKTEKTK